MPPVDLQFVEFFDLPAHPFFRHFLPHLAHEHTCTVGWIVMIYLHLHV